jgi:hypothetical protein
MQFRRSGTKNNTHSLISVPLEDPKVAKLTMNCSNAAATSKIPYIYSRNAVRSKTSK